MGTSRRFPLKDVIWFVDETTKCKMKFHWLIRPGNIFRWGLIAKIFLHFIQQNSISIQNVFAKLTHRLIRNITKHCNVRRFLRIDFRDKNLIIAHYHRFCFLFWAGELTQLVTCHCPCLGLLPLKLWEGLLGAPLGQVVGSSLCVGWYICATVWHPFWPEDWTRFLAVIFLIHQHQNDLFGYQTFQN